MPDSLRRGLESHFSPSQLAALQRAQVGIAGAGGLGSNAAMLLARSGIQAFVLVDYDRIEPSNLNRQHYWPEDIGKYKVDALREHLLRLNPCIKILGIREKLTDANLPATVASAPIWIEALDKANAKAAFVQAALQRDCKVAAASGIAGCGGLPLGRRTLGNMVVVGDLNTGIDQAPPLAPRVTQAAALLADTVLEWVLAGTHPMR